MCMYLHSEMWGPSTCNLEFGLRNSEIQARTRLDRLLGAWMDGSAAIVTSLGRARLGLGLGLGIYYG